MRLDTSKQLRVDFCKSNEETANDNLEEAETLFLRAMVHLSACRNFAKVCRCAKRPRGLPGYVVAGRVVKAYACSPDSPANVQTKVNCSTRDAGEMAGQLSGCRDEASGSRAYTA